MRPLCHLVPGSILASLIVAASVGGCARSHRASGASGPSACPLPTGTVCCSPGGVLRSPLLGCPLTCPAGTSLTPLMECHSPPLSERDGGPIDGGPPRGPDSAILTCPEVRGLASCFEDAFVEAGVRFDLPVLVDPCGCGGVAGCAVEVDDRPGAPTLRLTTTYCAGGLDCAACETIEASCAVPPLQVGRWNVVVNESPAFVMDVSTRPAPPRAGLCTSYAEPDGCALSQAPPRTRGWQPDSLCVTPRPGEPRRASIVVSSNCWACQSLQASCEVRLLPRLTDDLPDGAELYVTTFQHESSCDVDCPAGCFGESRECEVPALVPGSFYRVWVDGVVVTSFVAGASPGVCVDVAGLLPVPG